MLRSLRKGRSSAYFQHENTGHTIGAERFESDVSDGTAVLRFLLKPVDSNQRDDERYLHEEVLVSVTVEDDRVIDGFTSHVKATNSKITTWRLEILSRGEHLTFDVHPQLDSQDAGGALEFQVIPEHG